MQRDRRLERGELLREGEAQPIQALQCKPHGQWEAENMPYRLLFGPIVIWCDTPEEAKEMAIQLSGERLTRDNASGEERTLSGLVVLEPLSPK